MITVTKEAKTAEQFAAMFGLVAVFPQELVLWDKLMRDEVYKILKSRGVKCRKSSSKNQRLHPEYVDDYVGTYETGFGNQDYLTM